MGMIKGMTDEQIVKRDNLLIEEVRKHRGSENPITAEEARAFLDSCGYPVAKSSIGTMINRIALQRCLPICYINGKGYYWASKRSEIETTINDLQSRINALQEHIDHLKSFIVE